MDSTAPIHVNADKIVVKPGDRIEKRVKGWKKNDER
jgi:hypothetical protein